MRAHDGYFARKKTIHGFDLDAVRILRNVVDIRAGNGPSPSGECRPAVHGPQILAHCLIAMAELIHRVGYDSGVQILFCKRAQLYIPAFARRARQLGIFQ